jgi:hypothetical protein
MIPGPAIPAASRDTIVRSAPATSPALTRATAASAGAEGAARGPAALARTVYPSSSLSSLVGRICCFNVNISGSADLGASSCRKYIYGTYIFFLRIPLVISRKHAASSLLI